MNTRKNIILQYSIILGCIAICYSLIYRVLIWIYENGKNIVHGNISGSYGEVVFPNLAGMAEICIKSLIFGVFFGCITFIVLHLLPIKYKEIK